MEVWPLTLYLLTLMKDSESLEIGESRYLWVNKQHTHTFSWILALMDHQNEISCNANLISNVVSLTACECLAIPPIDSSAPLAVRDGSDLRYTLLGGTFRRTVYTNPTLTTQPISFHIHDKCNMTTVMDMEKWVYNFGIITHYAFDANVSITLEPMPTWSIDPFRMEKRFGELTKTGQPCYVVGWTSTQSVVARLKVNMYEGYNCSKYACMATKSGKGKCFLKAVTCTRNSTSGKLPYCHFEPGMPLICGSTGDTYAITEGAMCSPDHMNYLWKVSLVLDWIKTFVDKDISFFIDKYATTDGKNIMNVEHSTFFPSSSQGERWKIEPGAYLTIFPLIYHLADLV